MRKKSGKLFARREDREIFDWPLVSAVIPTYNYGHFVLEAIRSVQGQDYPRIELIIVDDGSSDQTREVLKGVKGIVYIYQKNQGLSAARNRGISVAAGEYVLFLDADDLIGRTSIRKRVEYLERNRDKSAVICRSACFRRSVYPEPIAALHREWRQPRSADLDLALHYFNVAPPHAFLIRKSAIKSASLYFDTGLRACEDYDFWLRLARETGVPGLIRSCWVYYRQHANSMSRSHVSQYRHDAELCRRLLTYGSFAAYWPNLVARTDADYLAAMLAASLRTARRLWHVDRSCFDDFVRGHVLAVQDRFLIAQAEAPVTDATDLYLSMARLTLYQMRSRDCSIDREIYCCVRDALAIRGSFFLRAVSSGRVINSPGLAMKLLKLDLHVVFVSVANGELSRFVGALSEEIRRAFTSLSRALTRRQ